MDLVRGAGAAVLAAVLLTAGCGAADKAEPNPSESAKPTDPALAEGEPAVDALTDFVCRADADGVWSASGTVKNSGEASAGFQVAVLVAEQGAGEAKTAELESIKPGETGEFTLADLPAAGEHPRCRVSVVRLDP